MIPGDDINMFLHNKIKKSQVKVILFSSGRTLWIGIM